jgi:hypothetical protein
MNIPDKPTRRMVLHGFFGIAALPLLSACGTVIYPERVNQKNHGGLDPSIVILDGIGLFIFIIPGLIAFAVDFGTDAIYFPEGKGAHDSEKTIFDQWKSEASKTSAIEQKTIEQFIAEQTGQIVRLDHTPLIVKELGRLDQFHTTLHQWA